MCWRPQQVQRRGGSLDVEKERADASQSNRERHAVVVVASVGVNDETRRSSAKDLSVARVRCFAHESGDGGQDSCTSLDWLYSGSIQVAPVIWLVAWLQQRAPLRKSSGKKSRTTGAPACVHTCRARVSTSLVVRRRRKLCLRSALNGCNALELRLKSKSKSPKCDAQPHVSR